MKTPICDFVREYAGKEPLRMHMPGHKGKPVLGPEGLDITEIRGADVLYRAEGIIRESEENASALFGSMRTVYSAEGSSLCIRAMLRLAQLHAVQNGKRCRIAAGRNAHRVFSDAAAMLDPEIRWIGTGDNLLQCSVDCGELEKLFATEETAPTAVFITDPDYLGNRIPLAPLAECCHRHGALLLTDNAHGAYLRFLRGGRHPLEQGADLCCDSAHKTLPVLTGGAYLHAGDTCPKRLAAAMERAMALFASTSPSYLILQSLDEANPILEGEFRERLQQVRENLDQMKARLAGKGWVIPVTEPMKLTILPKERGYTGTELAALLERKGVYTEFSDPDALVCMLSPYTEEEDLARLEEALGTLAARQPIRERPPKPGHPTAVLTAREAMLSPFETIPVGQSLGRILASASVSCPPAIPIVRCGERIDESAVRLFQYYEIGSCDVVLE